MLGRYVPRNGGFVVPNVYARKEMNFPVQIEQTNTKVSFL
jgi:hypothetical protein